MEQPARFGLADRLPCTNVPVFIHANVPHVAFPKLPPLHPLLLTEIFTADCKLFVSKTGLITEKCFYIMLLCVLDIFVELQHTISQHPTQESVDSFEGREGCVCQLEWG